MRTYRLINFCFIDLVRKLGIFQIAVFWPVCGSAIMVKVSLVWLAQAVYATEGWRQRHFGRASELTCVTPSCLPLGTPRLPKSCCNRPTGSLNYLACITQQQANCVSRLRSYHLLYAIN